MTNTNMLSLSARKMEKNFIAVIDKNYERKPQNEYSIEFWLDRLDNEIKELSESWSLYLSTNYDYKLEFFYLDNCLDELSDLSNIVDYMYEQLMETFIILRRLKGENRNDKTE